MDNDITSFLHYLAQEKRMSPHTVTNYQRDLKRLLAFCEQHNLVTWTALKSSHIRQFIAQLHQQGLSGKTIQRALSAIRSLYRYLIREGLADLNPAQAVQAPKSKKRLPSTLDVDQMNGLLDISAVDSLLLAAIAR
jgi:integrase/recombinase XerC